MKTAKPPLLRRDAEEKRRTRRVSGDHLDQSFKTFPKKFWPLRSFAGFRKYGPIKWPE